MLDIIKQQAGAHAMDTDAGVAWASWRTRVGPEIVRPLDLAGQAALRLAASPCTHRGPGEGSAHEPQSQLMQALGG